jgi:hypothetical protein
MQFPDSGWPVRIAALVGVTVASAVISFQLFEYLDASGRSGWPAAPSDNIMEIVEATYGASCRVSAPQSAAAIKDGNATAAIAKLCDKAIDDCSFVFDLADMGDPLPGCGKDLSIVWRCVKEPNPRRLLVPAEAHRKPVYISCLKR